MTQHEKPSSLMRLPQSLRILYELGLLELESPACPDPPPGWINDLRMATETLGEFLRLTAPPVGRAFLSARGPEMKSIRTQSRGKGNEYHPKNTT